MWAAGLPEVGATTSMAAESLEVNWVRITSAAARVEYDAGSTRSSGWPNLTPRNGARRTRSRITMALAMGTGRRMTKVASRCQKPSSGALA